MVTMSFLLEIGSRYANCNAPASFFSKENTLPGWSLWVKVFPTVSFKDRPAMVIGSIPSLTLKEGKGSFAAFASAASCFNEPAASSSSSNFWLIASKLSYSFCSWPALLFFRMCSKDLIKSLPKACCLMMDSFSTVVHAAWNIFSMSPKMTLNFLFFSCCMSLLERSLPKPSETLLLGERKFVTAIASLVRLKRLVFESSTSVMADQKSFPKEIDFPWDGTNDTRNAINGKSAPPPP